MQGKPDINVIEVLERRGFIEAVTTPDLKNLAASKLSVYCGFDPTGDSLHIGHLVPMMALSWFQKCGHDAYAIVGGATGMIGDPSGKSEERNLLDEETLQKNIEGIKSNLEPFLCFDKENQSAKLLNNFDWFKNYSFVDFLRDVGKHFRLGVMLSKESVKIRLNSEEGISFTEFSYQLLQGYDFLYLFNNYGVNLQIGGSDQWGNITAGVDLVRKVHGKAVHGLTFPLLTRSDGQKFGKTASGAVWLSPKRLSPYEFYQYFIRVPDADVGQMLRLLTFVELERIDKILDSMKEPGYVPNSAQKILAEEITRIVHGEEALQKAISATLAAAPGTLAKLDSAALEAISEDIPSASFPKEKIAGSKLIDIMTETGLQKSKGDARRLIKNGGVYLNNARIEEEDRVLCDEDLIDGKFVLLSAGKKNRMLIRAL